jgi:hypothetical protein
MAIHTADKITLAHAMGVLELSAADLVRMTGLGAGAVSRAISGGSHQTNIYTAALIAEALGMEICELSWPAGLTDAGRPPLTGVACTVKPRFAEKYCEKHHLALPLSGICDMCA